MLIARAVGQRAREVAQLAVDLDRQRGARQPGADGGRGVGAGGAVGELELGAVREGGVHAGRRLAGRPAGSSVRGRGA